MEQIEWKIEDGIVCAYLKSTYHFGGDIGCVIRYKNTSEHGWWQLFEWDNGPERLVEQSTDFAKLVQTAESLS